MQAALLIIPVTCLDFIFHYKGDISCIIIASPHFRFSFSLFKYWDCDLAMKEWEVISSNCSHNCSMNLLSRSVARDQFSPFTGGPLLESDFNIIIVINWTIISAIMSSPSISFFTALTPGQDSKWCESYHALFWISIANYKF